MMHFEDDLNNSLKVLRDGGVILYPTDTLWGIGCDPTSPVAVEKIFNIKTRNEGKGLIALVSGVAMLERYVRDVPRIAYDLIEVSESPLTIIYPEGKNLAAGVCGEDGSAALRICNEEFCSELIRRFRKPLVSTSANLSGMPPPATFSEISEAIKGSVDYVVKYRQDDRRKFTASPVIKVEKNGVFTIIRK
jgi:L-threonylcarbamoyladenylate synthase